MFLDDEFTIPNALYILFGPLYSSRDQLDVLTVSTSYKSTLADVYAIGNKGTYYDSTILHNGTRHKYTVNYLCTWSYLSSGKDYGIGNLAFNYTALGYVSVLDPGLCANILRKCGYIFGLNFPGKVA